MEKSISKPLFIFSFSFLFFGVGGLFRGYMIMSKGETPALPFFEDTVDPDQVTYGELFFTLIENACLQLECCRLTGNKFWRSVVHKRVQHDKC